MKILVAYDGSKHAQAAIRDLRRSGIPREFTALVTTVGDLPASGVGSPSLDPTIARRAGALLEQTQGQALLSLSHAEEIAKEGAALVADMCPGSEVTTHVRLGEPAEVIIESADAWGADLIVVGAHGRSALGRLLIGSVSQHVATNASRSVLVARRVVERGDSPVRIIVGIDGSPTSHAAVDAVARRSWGEHTEVRIVAVAGTQRPNAAAKRVPTAAAWIDESNQSKRDTAQVVLEHSIRALASARLHVSERFAEGGVPSILNEQAEEFGADCIFRQRRQLQR